MKCVYSPQKPMGRPRKRRREDTSTEETQQGQQEPSPAPPGGSLPAFEDSRLIPQNDLTIDFSDFGGVPMNDTFDNTLLPPTSYVEGYGQVPAYDSR